MDHRHNILWLDELILIYGLICYKTSRVKWRKTFCYLAEILTSWYSQHQLVQNKRNLCDVSYLFCLFSELRHNFFWSPSRFHCLFHSSQYCLKPFSSSRPWEKHLIFCALLYCKVNLMGILLKTFHLLTAKHSHTSSCFSIQLRLASVAHKWPSPHYLLFSYIITCAFYIRVAFLVNRLLWLSREGMQLLPSSFAPAPYTLSSLSSELLFLISFYFSQPKYNDSCNRLLLLLLLLKHL